jgi:hypothetical protein
MVDQKFTSSNLSPSPRRFRGLSACRVVANHVLKRDVRTARGRTMVDGVIEHDSKNTLTIQLCDVLLGAVAATWQKEPVVGAKLELQRVLALSEVST